MSGQHPEFISLVPVRSPHEVVGERVVMLPGISMEILTTRRIELETWVLDELNDPYWRLYIPTMGEASVWTRVGSDKVETRLVPGEPTSFPPHHIQLAQPNCLRQWYVHFTLGPNGDRAMPGIYPMQ